MIVVDFQNIHRAYVRGKDVLDDLSFSIEAGQVVGLVGRNGAGKTTLLRIAMGMIEPQQGRVKLFGLDPREKPLLVKRKLGYVSEDQILPPFLTIGEVIDLHRGLFPLWDDEMERRLRDRFSLSRGTKIRNLSKGQARQLALVCAMCHRPELLLLDEPAGGLDPSARREFLETSIQYLNEEGATILFSSHYMSDVERLADRIVMLHEGKVLIDEPLDQLQERYSLALVPNEAGTGKAQLLGLAACLGVRERAEVLHVIFKSDPDVSKAVLERELGIKDTRCSTIALEEMFIEIAGGQS
jgi:ABC-2 type transport system ATP-binding protein